MENTSLVMNELTSIKNCMQVIQEKIEDISLSGDDLISTQKAEQEFAEGKTTSSENLKKEIGL